MGCERQRPQRLAEGAARPVYALGGGALRRYLPDDLLPARQRGERGERCVGGRDAFGLLHGLHTVLRALYGAAAGDRYRYAPPRVFLYAQFADVRAGQRGDLCAAGDGKRVSRRGDGGGVGLARVAGHFCRDRRGVRDYAFVPNRRARVCGGQKLLHAAAAKPENNPGVPQFCRNDDWIPDYAGGLCVF